MNPMPFDFDFMVQPTATYVTSHQVELVLSLLEEYVDPISIPDYVRRRCSGVDLTLQDVKAIKYGNFHVSGSGFHVRMLNSGNLIAIDVVDDFFQLLPIVSSIHCIRIHIEEEYNFVIDDSDLVDLYDGAFHIAGPKTIDITTKRKFFVPRFDSSEAVWMFERGCSTAFLSRYVRYKFGTHLPAQEIIALSVASQEEIARDAALNAIANSASPPAASIPTCLKQTVHRAPPPPPINTSNRARPKKGVYAVQHRGGTYTANPDVFCHHRDGTYTLYADLKRSCNSNCQAPRDSLSPIVSVHSRTLSSTETDEDSVHSDSSRLDSSHCTLDEGTSDSDLGSDFDVESLDYSLMSADSSYVLVHLAEGDYLIDFDQPDREWIRVPGPGSRGSTPVDDDLPSFPSSVGRYSESHSPRPQDIDATLLTPGQNGLFSLADSEDKTPDIVPGSAAMDLDSEEDLALTELDIMSPLKHLEGQTYRSDQGLAYPSTFNTTVTGRSNLESDAEPVSHRRTSFRDLVILFDQGLESVAISIDVCPYAYGRHHVGTATELDLENQAKNHLQLPPPKRRSSLGCGRRTR